MLTVRRLLALGVVATTAAYVAIVAPNASADVTIEPFPGSVTDEGRLEIETTSTSLTVRRYLAGASTAHSSLTVQRNNKCLVDGTALAPLLEITPTAGGAPRPIGYVSNGLGTRDNNTCNTANGTVGDDETMDLTLGATLRSQGILIDRARFDLEGKFGTSLIVTTRTTVGGAVTTVPTASPWSASDNGSDSGPSDNRDVFVGTSSPGDNFVTVSIRPDSVDDRGQISLESGGDYGAGAPEHYTTLWLVRQTASFEYSLTCGGLFSETAGGSGNSADFAAVPPAPTAVYPTGATVSRYDEGPTAGCEPIGVNIGSNTGNVLLRKTTTDVDLVEQSPRIRFELVWAVPTSMLGGPTDPFKRLIDLDGESGIFAPEPAQYCSSYSPQVGALDPNLNELDGFIDPAHAGYALHPEDARFPALGVLPWCVIADVRTPGMVGTTPVIFQRVVWDGYGDPKFF